MKIDLKQLNKLFTAPYGAWLGYVLGLALFMPYFWWPNFSGLNSDHAVPILMAEDFQFDRDWYYWGQNRLGSFFSLLAFLLSHLGLSLYQAAALSQILILSGSYFFLQALLHKPLFKILLALVLFLPIYPFTVQVMPGHPILAQTFFLAAFLFCFHRMGRWWQAALLPLLFAGALWSSELSIVLAPVLIWIYRQELWLLIKQRGWLLLLSGALGLYFLYYAKSQAVHIAAYSQWLASWEAIGAVFVKHLGDLGDFLLLQTNKPWNGLLFYLLLATVLFLLLRLKLWWGTSRLAALFLASALLAYLAVNFSYWNALMERPYHHLSPAYLFLLLGLIYLADAKASGAWLRPLVVASALVHAVAGLHFIQNFPLKINGRISSRQTETLLQQHRERFGSASIGLLGNYWNVYLPDALSEQIRAIPFEGDLVRDFRFKEAVFAQDYFILMRMNWLEQYPQQIEQHGYLLEKTGPCDSVGEIDYCYYQLLTERPAD